MADADPLAELTASLEAASLSPSAPPLPPFRGAHASLGAMLGLAQLEPLRVAGDGNCAYHASCAGAGAALLEAAELWPLEHASPAGGRPATASDMRLQRKLRERCVDWLQLDESAHHRHFGSASEPEWDEAAGRYRPEPRPPASAMEPHRSTGTYAQTPQLRAIAEVLGCCVVAVDAATLYDRVPVYTAGRKQTVQLRSWRDQLAPALAARRGSPAPGACPVIVIVGNGQLGGGGHFDGTRRVDTAVPTGA